MGDEISLTGSDESWTIEQKGLRIVRGLEGDERQNLLTCWTEIFRGLVHSHRQFMDVEAEFADDGIVWRISLSN